MTNDFAGNFHGKVLFDTSRLKKIILLSCLCGYYEINQIDSLGTHTRETDIINSGMNSDFISNGLLVYRFINVQIKANVNFPQFYTSNSMTRVRIARIGAPYRT